AWSCVPASVGMIRYAPLRLMEGTGYQIAITPDLLLKNAVYYSVLVLAPLPDEFRHLNDLFFFSSRSRHTRSKRDWSSDVCSSDLVRYFDTNTYYRQPVVRGAVSRKGPLIVDEWKFAQGSSKALVKAVLTGPVTLASLSLDKHYGNKKALAGDLSSAIGEEVGALVKAGASHIQIDEPILTQRPADLSLVSESLDRIRGHKAKATLTLFTFFGDVARIYQDLQDVPADILGLDLVQGAATWSVLAKHGSSKPLVLGVIDARNTKEEDPVAVATKVSQLKSAVDLKTSYLSPSNGLEFLPRDRARRKLRILHEAARVVGVAA